MAIFSIMLNSLYPSMFEGKIGSARLKMWWRRYARECKESSPYLKSDQNNLFHNSSRN
jgi:hypothetical protein